MPRVVSFIVLLAILLLVSAVFFQVMAHFVVPLFLASVFVVVFKPLHAWVVERIPGYPRVSALATTLLILLAVLLPTIWLGWKAAIELRAVAYYLNPPDATNVGDDELVRASEEPGTLGADASAQAPIQAGAANETPSDDADRDQLLQMIANRTPKPIKEFYTTVTDRPLDKEAVRPWYLKARGLVGSIAVSGAQTALKLVFGLAIMVLALYYFLADGPRMLAGLMKLSPLDDEYERELLDKFANISRAVVVASLASAVAQGLLAGIGYYFALDDGAPIFLLTMLTMVLAIVPFAGAAAVWVPTAAWIYLYQPIVENGQPVLDAAGQPIQGDAFTAIALAVYGVCVVSAIDNVIKPLVLHGQSNLHPLVALISILGGVQTLGPIGILVGPMLVAFIQALLNMVNKELLHFSGGTLNEKHGARATSLALEPAKAAVGVAAVPEKADAAKDPADGKQSPSPPARPARAPAEAGTKRRRRRK